MHHDIICNDRAIERTLEHDDDGQEMLRTKKRDGMNNTDFFSESILW